MTKATSSDTGKLGRLQTRGKSWYLYLLACADGTTYTGVTTDPRRRLAEHNAGRGARYTAQRGRRPVRLLGVWRFPDQSSATRAEICLKRRRSALRKRQLAATRASFEGAPFCPEYVQDGKS
jgi:putative endonuclease